MVAASERGRLQNSLGARAQCCCSRNITGADDRPEAPRTSPDVRHRTDCDRKLAVGEESPLPLWDSFESIKAFAGPEYEKAVYYPEDKKFLLKLDPRVTHFEVLVGPVR